jgi:hypothetical protein
VSVPLYNSLVVTGTPISLRSFLRSLRRFLSATHPRAPSSYATCLLLVRACRQPLFSAMPFAKHRRLTGSCQPAHGRCVLRVRADKLNFASGRFGKRLMSEWQARHGAMPPQLVKFLMSSCKGGPARDAVMLPLQQRLLTMRQRSGARGHEAGAGPADEAG